MIIACQFPIFRLQLFHLALPFSPPTTPPLDPHHKKCSFYCPHSASSGCQVYPIFQFESDVWTVREDGEKSYTIFRLIWLGRTVVNLPFPAPVHIQQVSNNCWGGDQNARFDSIQLRLQRFVLSCRATIRKAFSSVKISSLFENFLRLWRTTKIAQRVQFRFPVKALIRLTYTSVCFLSSIIEERRLDVGPAEAPWSW